MPLKPGSSSKVISQNISELTHHGSKKRPHKQIVAIALHKADETKSSKPRAGGTLHKMQSQLHGTDFDFNHPSKKQS